MAALILLIMHHNGNSVSGGVTVPPVPWVLKNGAQALQVLASLEYERVKYCHDSCRPENDYSVEGQ
jgi:hypothetical protein